MKKILLCMSAVVALGLASCTSVRHTASVIPVKTEVISENNADLKVSQKKISYTFHPTNSYRKTGERALIESAVAEALKANDNSDVLVSMQYEIKKRKSKIMYVTIEGYPAKYVNIRPIKK